MINTSTCNNGASMSKLFLGVCRHLIDTFSSEPEYIDVFREKIKESDIPETELFKWLDRYYEHNDLTAREQYHGSYQDMEWMLVGMDVAKYKDVDPERRANDFLNFYNNVRNCN